MTIFILMPDMTTYACTEWSAHGDMVLDGGTIIVKNRDFIPGRQELKLIEPKEGYRYFGLIDKGITFGGVNEHGLVVFNQVTGYKDAGFNLNRMIGMANLPYTVLTNYKSVDEVIENAHNFPGATTLNIADKTKSAYIEIGVDGNYAVKENINGFIYHTNHYLEDNMVPFIKVNDSESSLIRLERIEDLLSSVDGPFTLENFIQISENQKDGPNNSIWRTGSESSNVRTLSTFAVRIPETGSPQLYIKLEDKVGEPQFFEYNVDDIFTGKVDVVVSKPSIITSKWLIALIATVIVIVLIVIILLCVLLIRFIRKRRQK
ncbi:MAG: hypothetical protein JEZ08_12790 [Clostridiales bacterium]|nr:hypothetical protein [Clostridiales bacterium]